MWQDLLAKFTHIGDTKLLVLCGLGVCLYLWGSEERRSLAQSWAMAFGFCVLLTILGKLALHAVRWNEGTSLRLLSPSGHVAIGTCFYGCCAIMLSAGRNRTVRLVAWVGTVALLSALAASRLELGLHSVPEIIIAFAIGAASLVVFTRRLNAGPPVRLNAGHMISLILLLFVAYYMPPVDGEALIIQVVRTLTL
jgi:hypothetical protein